MLVCHCHAVTDREIRAAVRQGADCAASVGAACGAGTSCGGCHDLIEYLVRDEQGAGGAGPRPVRRLPLLAEAG